MGSTDTPQRWQALTLDALRAERAQRSVSFLEFFQSPSFRMGLYHLPAGSVDGQGAHSEDEIYYVAAGSARISIDGVDHVVGPGATAFVRAGVSHRFHTITEDLDAIVFFSTGSSSASDPVGVVHSADQMVTARDQSQNVWDPFLQIATMSLGMYMLPRASGGDATLTHTFDEINVVVRGRGRFSVDGQAMDIAPGSIVFVERGAGHFFRGISDDLDVLILWDR